MVLDCACWCVGEDAEISDDAFVENSFDNFNNDNDYEYKSFDTGAKLYVGNLPWSASWQGTLSFVVVLFPTAS